MKNGAVPVHQLSTGRPGIRAAWMPPDSLWKRMRHWLMVSSCAGISILTALVLVVGESGRAQLVSDYEITGLRGVYAGLRRQMDPPNVDWDQVSPISVGLDKTALHSLQSSLALQGTKALIVSRRGSIAYEWYSPDFGPNRKYGLAAMTKGVVAAPILLGILQDSAIDLDTSAASFIPHWREDERKSRITLRQLASHSSGLDDVDFKILNTGWKQDYLDNPSHRFKLAVDRTPVLYDPGTRQAYSGVGFYALAYALASILNRPGERTDLASYYDEAIMKPLGIPPNAWSISYGETYNADGMRLSAIGSGSGFTARAVARVGELFIGRGTFDNRIIIDERWIDEALAPTVDTQRMAPEQPHPAAGIGWWLNTSGYSASLPRDAAVAVGGTHQILVIIPSLDLIAVRFGEYLRSQSENDYWSVMEEQFFNPLLSSVISGEQEARTR